MDRSTLPPDTGLGTVHLRVGDLAAQAAFYEDVLGFSLLGEDGATAAMGAPDGRPLLILHAEPGARPRVLGSTGLYHMAFRLPTRAHLGAMILRIRNSRTTITGFSDHNVSEAVYLSDPEGNDIEFYVDRARDVWYSVDGGVFMTTEPLDVPGLLVAAPGPAPRLPSGTVVGHIHLTVSSLDAAEDFYVGHLGFDVVTRSYPGALFVSAGGYHHHVALNTWGGDGAPRSADGRLGLMSFDIVVPCAETRQRILGGADEGTLPDQDRVGVRIAAH